MAVVRRHKGDKVKETKNGNLVITRTNGTVIKLNKNKGTITRTKPDGTVVNQKLTSGPTKPLFKTGSAHGGRVKWTIEKKLPMKSINTNTGGR